MGGQRVDQMWSSTDVLSWHSFLSSPSLSPSLSSAAHASPRAALPPVRFGGFFSGARGVFNPPPTQQTPPRGRRFLTDIAPPFHQPHSSCITVRDYRCHGPGRPSRYTPPCTVWTCWWMAERPQPFTEADSRSTVIAPGGRYWFNVAVSIRVIDDFGPSPGAPASPPPVLAPSH